MSFITAQVTMRVLILFCIIATAFASHQCGENEHFESCGTACPLTCSNYDNPPRFCVLRCDIGCFCDEGYVRSSDGRCVQPEQCPDRAEQVCSENQRYLECGTACPLTCDNYANPPKICPAMCVSGCHCEEGYVKTRDGRCVRPEDCPVNAPRPVVQTCKEKPDAGMCLAYMPQWYYNAEEGKCYEFIYGGCQGNGNRYETEEECLENCRGVRPEHSESSVCDLPATTGRCRGYFPRYYFNRDVGQCQKFVYGGCGGNGNNFETRDACEATCANQGPGACREDKAVGTCDVAFQRFYFNKYTRRCEEFTYKGCNGNSNNFLSLEECEAVCGA